MNPDSEAPRILIIRLSAIGDCVMASPVVEALRQRFPRAYLVWAVGEKSQAVVEGNPFLDETLLWRSGRRGFLDLVREVRARRFDVVLELQGLLKSSLLMGLSGAPRRLVSPRFGRLARFLGTEMVAHPPGYIYPPLRYLCWAAALGAQSNLGDGAHLRVPVGEVDRAAARALLLANEVAPQNTLVALNPGVSVSNRRWPVAKFAAAARLLAQTEPMARFVVLGGPGDVGDATFLREQLGERCLTAAGQLSLKGTAALLEECSLLLTNDTGPMHIGVAVGTPVVGIFGPVEARRRLPPYGPHCGIEHNEPCRERGRPLCAKGDPCACLERVTAEEVAVAAGRILHSAVAKHEHIP